MRSDPFKASPFDRRTVSGIGRGYITGDPGDLPPITRDDESSAYRYPSRPMPLTFDSVAAAIPDSIGSIAEIAKRLGRRRGEVRRFIDDNADLQEMIDEEQKASVERVMMAQYTEALAGNPQARESYIKMVSGFFSKKGEDPKEKEPRTQVIIQMEAKPQIVQALDPTTGELVEVDAGTLLPVSPDSFSDDGGNAP